MSSDVYIDTGVGRENVLRVGHLGVLAYFGTDLVGWLGFLSGACPIIDDHIQAVVPKAFEHMRNVVLVEVQEFTPGYRRAMFGYDGRDTDWEDLLTGEAVEEFLWDHHGERWYVRVD